MSKESRVILINLMYDALEELGDDISPIEIYGVLETIKMDVHDEAIAEIEKAKKEKRKPRWIN